MTTRLCFCSEYVAWCDSLVRLLWKMASLLEKCYYKVSVVEYFIIM